MSESEIYDFMSDSDDPAFQELLAKGLSGDLIAQYRLFHAYFEGSGVERACGKADFWAGRMREHNIWLSEEEQKNIPRL